MGKPNDLRFGRIGADFVHTSVDMQRIFAEATDWHTPWMEKILSHVETLVGLAPERTIFTRFVPENPLRLRMGAGGVIIGAGDT